MNLKTIKVGIFIMIFGFSVYSLIHLPKLPTLEYINKLFEISIVISSILFGVLGIWLSSIYGESLKAIFQNHNNEKTESIISEIKRLFYPLFFSFISVAVSLIYFFLQIFRSNLFLASIDIFHLKVFSLSIYTAMTILQLNYLALIFSPLLEIIKRLFIKKNKEYTENKLFGKKNKII